MTFNDGKEQETIKTFKNNGNYYEVEYLDGTLSKYYNSEESHYSYLEDTIMMQVFERDLELYDQYKKEIKINIITNIVAFLSMYASLSKENQLLACLAFSFMFFSLAKYRKNKKRLNELKKYRLYLEYMDEFQKNKDITKLLEIDSYYRVPLDLTTLDYYSYNDLKVLKRALKKKK